MKVRDVVNRLTADGWVSEGRGGSDKVTVPSGHGANIDLRPGTLRNIERQAGWRR